MGSPGQERILTATLWVFVVSTALVGCGAPGTPEPAVAFECPPNRALASVVNLNYPDEDCESAAVAAASKLDSGHVRRACQTATAAASLPPSASAVHVTQCITTDGRGVFVDLEACCPEPIAPVEPATNTEHVARFAKPSCSNWQTRARAEGLHYPDASSCESILPGAETALTSEHYRSACRTAAAQSSKPALPLEARVVECRTGGGNRGATVAVELCCDVRVFEENIFRSLVMQRSPEEILADLGTPRLIEERQGELHWKYPFDVVRKDRVFPEVTLVFRGDRVDAYFF